MPELKYQKYIVTDLKPTPREIEHQAEYNTFATRIALLSDDLIKGCFRVACSWYWKAQTSKIDQEPHVHDYDTAIGFLGSDPQNPHDLNAEVEFWIEDEKYLITKSCLIYLPMGLKHLPMIFQRIDKPVLFLAFSANNQEVK